MKLITYHGICAARQSCSNANKKGKCDMKPQDDGFVHCDYYMYRGKE